MELGITKLGFVARRGEDLVREEREFRTESLIQQIRIHRGRWTLAAILRALGVDDEDPANLRRLRRLCHRYELLYKPDVRWARRAGFHASQSTRVAADMATARARQNLREQIEAARTEGARPFKKGDLAW